MNRRMSKKPICRWESTCDDACRRPYGDCPSNCQNYKPYVSIEELEKEKADLQQRLDWAQGFLDKDVEYDELNKLRKENAELKEYLQKYNRHRMLCFAADMVYKALNPKSTMCTPNCVYIKIESELENWELSK